MALEAGLAMPPYRPLSRAELTALLERALASGAAALDDPDERAALVRLLATFRADGTDGGADRADGPAPPAARAGLRARFVQNDLGDVAWGEAGVREPPGLSAALEPSLAVGRGRWWGGATARVSGRLFETGRLAPAPLLQPGWPPPTGGAARRAARLDGGAWRLAWPRAVVGARLGGWAVTGGWSPARTGPGDGGGLLLSETGRTFPSLTLRRAAPLAWRGPLRPLAPSAVLLRGGRVSAQEIRARDGWSPTRTWRDDPWFLQWLVAWTPARWLSAGASLSALAVPRSGSLWPDLLQVGFPLLTATHVETERGPVTDRLFAVTFEARWREAPWPLLPARAGRLYWEYGGEDFLPPGDVPLLPQISAPASLLGVELVSPRWDLALEYVELEHPWVLWYGNSGFEAGYTHHDWPLGHPLGGTGEALAGELRWRPRGRGRELVVRGERSTAGRADVTPSRLERWSWEASLRPAPGPDGWSVSVTRWRERAVPYDPADGAGARADWWRAAVSLTR